MSVVLGSFFIVLVVFLIPGTAILGAVYAQHLMETRPPRGLRFRRSAAPARAPGAARPAVVPVRA